MMVAYLRLGALVEKQHAGLEDTPQFGPAFEGAPDFEPVRQHHHGGVLESGHQLPGHPLLLTPILLPLVLVGLHSSEATRVGGRSERHLQETRSISNTREIAYNARVS